MNKKKIFNDPVYGFITLQYPILFDIIEHPYFQRLRRIKQLGLTEFVYPGALHTRFHHALGAVHLMSQAIDTLRSKNIDISEEEAEAVSIAILLHDIGHGPFSHTLENTLLDVHHETLSLWFMEALNEEFSGKLNLAIQIFQNRYKKQFLHQLISGQLDMDRMDYLNRDSFFTGVSEGVIGYDRIIKMLQVQNGDLVVEEKGLYSIEKFLIARRLMYWQVYLHKTVLCAEQMLIKTLARAKELVHNGHNFQVTESLSFFLESKEDHSEGNKKKILDHFALLDDVDIMHALKKFTKSEDFTLSFLSKSLLNRNLFKVELKNFDFDSNYIDKMRHSIATQFEGEVLDLDSLVFSGKESNMTYTSLKEEIKIYYKSGAIIPLSEVSDLGIQPRTVTKYYLCSPKSL